MPSSVTDARTVVEVERLMNDGVVIYSRKCNGVFLVTLSTGKDVIGGSGYTFPEAFSKALDQLRGELQMKGYCWGCGQFLIIRYLNAFCTPDCAAKHGKRSHG